MRFALIKDGKIWTVTEQDSTPEIEGQWVDVTGLHVGPGFSYDGQMFTEPSLKDENNKPILAQIAALEAGQMRGMREYMISGDKTGLQALDTKISALRAKLEK